MLKKLKSLEPYFKFTKEKNRTDTLYYDNFYSDDELCLLRMPIDKVLDSKYIYCEDECGELDFNFLMRYSSQIKKAYNSINDKELFLRYLMRVITTDKRFYLLPISNFEIYHHPLLKNNFEVMIDCGSYDMKDLKNFNAKEIFAFEPNKFQFSKLMNVKKSSIAVSDKKGISDFYLNGQASSLTRESNQKIKVVTNSLDNIFKNKKIDFIKMDIEGEESNAIMGASNIIKRWKPNLAISLYHKKTDFFEIPNLIKSINKDYIFYLGNHSLLNIDFVLYAI